MAVGTLSKRRFFARLAIAHVATWIALLFLAWKVGGFLARTGSLLLMGLSVREAAAGLIVLSVVIVPLVVCLHAHLYWRDKRSLATHVGAGSVVPLLTLLIADLALPHIEVVPSRFPNPLIPVWLTVVIAGAIGGTCSGLVRPFAIRLLRTRDAEILRRFD